MTSAAAERQVDYSAVRDGLDESAFRSLYEAAASSLKAFIHRQVSDDALAADLTQDAFVRLLRAKLPRMNEAQLKGYLYRTASSLVADHWRRLNRERSWRILFRREEAVEALTLTGVNRVFLELKARQRSLLWLAYVEGMSHEEIGEALKVKPKSVKVLLYRARKRLAASLEKHGLRPEESL